MFDSYFIRDGLVVNEFNFDVDMIFDNGEIVFGFICGVFIVVFEDFLLFVVEIGNIMIEIMDVLLLLWEFNYYFYKYVNLLL